MPEVPVSLHVSGSNGFSFAAGFCTDVGLWFGGCGPCRLNSVS